MPRIEATMRNPYIALPPWTSLTARESTTTYRDRSLESHLWRAGSSGRVLIATGGVDRDIPVVQSPRPRDPPPQPRVEPSPSWRGGGEPAPRAGTDPPSRRRFRLYARFDRPELRDRGRAILRTDVDPVSVSGGRIRR